MRLFGLIGYPLSHSFSAEWFGKRLSIEGITDAQYHNFPLKDIREIEYLMQNPDLRGFNVTIPHKETVINYLDGLSADAQKIKAVNCVVKYDGKWIGHNTDWRGFMDTLRESLCTEYPSALILGSGGASKAIAYALDSMKIDYITVSRTGDTNSHVGYDELTPAIISGHKLIINTTPLGTWPDMETAPQIPYDLLTPDHFLYDLVYNPAITQFLKKGFDRGCKIKNGLGMLQRQAELSWKLFGL